MQSTTPAPIKKRRRTKKPKLSKDEQMNRYLQRGINRYPFKFLKVGGTMLFDEPYTRENMTKASNAARNWKNKSKLCKRWKFSVSKTDDNRIEIKRVR